MKRVGTDTNVVPSTIEVKPFEVYSLDGWIVEVKQVEDDWVKVDVHDHPPYIQPGNISFLSWRVETNRLSECEQLVPVKGWWHSPILPGKDFLVLKSIGRIWEDIRSGGRSFPIEYKEEWQEALHDDHEFQQAVKTAAAKMEAK